MTDDELIETMFDEIKEARMVNGKPRVTDEQPCGDGRRGDEEALSLTFPGRGGGSGRSTHRRRDLGARA